VWATRLVACGEKEPLLCKDSKDYESGDLLILALWKIRRGVHVYLSVVGWSALQPNFSPIIGTQQLLGPV
jgi:hypothetical protein